MQFAPENGVYSYFRYTDEAAVMVIFNKNEESYKPEIKRFQERTKGYISATDILSGKTFQFDKLEVPARGVLVLELK